jgi:hypothetical protein
LAGKRKVPETKSLVRSALTISLEGAEEVVEVPPPEEGLLDESPPDVENPEDSEELEEE